MSNAILYQNNDFTGEVKGLKIFKVQVQPSSRIIGAPVEDGSVIFDNKVVDPPKIVVTGSVYISDSPMDKTPINSQWASNFIVRMFLSRKIGKNNEDLFSICDGDQCFNNLMLESYGKTHDSDRHDLANYELTFKKILVVQKKDGGIIGEHSDTQKNGYQSGDQI